MDFVPRQKRPSLVCSKSDEIEKARVKNTIETRRTLSRFRFTAKAVATALRAVQSNIAR